MRRPCVSPPYCLGHTYNKMYPLCTPLCQAITAFLNGSWNDAIARADGLVFFVATLAIVYLAVLRFSRQRWLAALAALTISARRNALRLRVTIE